MIAFSATRVRLAIVGIFVALLGLAGLSSVYSQPPGIPRPPGAPGGIGGMPGPPGGFSGLPRPPALPGGAPGIPGAPGGIVGNPGGLPSAPRTPDLPPIHRPEVPKTELVWSCSRCGAELGRGLIPPDVSVCPKCGAHLIGGGLGRRPLTPPSAGSAPSGNDAAPSPIDAGTGAAHVTSPTNPLPQLNFSSAPRIPDTGAGPGAAKIAGYILGGALAIGLAALVARTALNKGVDDRPRRRRRRRDLDDL
jgi:DNA-directed RNA polymerase subunit RPC12/RpoP